MKKLRAILVKALVVVGVVFGLLSFVGTVFSLSDTWHHFAGFVSARTSSLSDQQASYLRTGLLVLGACLAGFELGRTRKDRDPSKLLIGSSVLCIAGGIALFGAAALEQLEQPPPGKIGVSPNHALGGGEKNAGKAPPARKSGHSSSAQFAGQSGDSAESPSGRGAAKASKGTSCTCPSFPAPVPEEERVPEYVPEESEPEEIEEFPAEEPEEFEPEEFESFETEEVVFE